MRVDDIRGMFPALARQVGGRQAIYFDGPGGSQVPRSVADAVSNHLLESNANYGPNFITGRETIAVVQEVRRKLAKFLNCGETEVSFGQNMTSLTFAFSRALSMTWQVGDNVVVSEMDHDANITPWVLAARDRGVEVRVARYDREAGTVTKDEVLRLVDDRTKLVAITLSSNLVGSHVEVGGICREVRGRGVRVFVDGVHHAPHERIDVKDLGCDFLVCSAYKFFGPHVGILFGRGEVMRELNPYKIIPASDAEPHCWETGTQNFAGLAGLSAGLDYLWSLGRDKEAGFSATFDYIRELEAPLVDRFLERFRELKNYVLHGIAGSEGRSPTFAFTSQIESPERLAKRLGDQGVFVWNGHMYAVRLVDALGLKREEGVLRVGLMHYNTVSEVDRLFDLLEGL